MLWNQMSKWIRGERKQRILNLAKDKRHFSVDDLYHTTLMKVKERYWSWLFNKFKCIIATSTILPSSSSKEVYCSLLLKALTKDSKKELGIHWMKAFKEDKWYSITSIYCLLSIYPFVFQNLKITISILRY